MDGDENIRAKNPNKPKSGSSSGFVGEKGCLSRDAMGSGGRTETRGGNGAAPVLSPRGAAPQVTERNQSTRPEWAAHRRRKPSSTGGDGSCGRGSGEGDMTMDRAFSPRHGFVRCPGALPQAGMDLHRWRWRIPAAGRPPDPRLVRGGINDLSLDPMALMSVAPIPQGQRPELSQTGAAPQVT